MKFTNDHRLFDTLFAITGRNRFPLRIVFTLRNHREEEDLYVFKWSELKAALAVVLLYKMQEHTKVDNDYHEYNTILYIV